MSSVTDANIRPLPSASKLNSIDVLL